MADVEYDDSLLATSENLGAVDWDSIEGGGRAEMGGRTAKLFDPDLVDTTMKQWLLDHCRKHVQGKFGQLSLLIGTKGNNHAH